MTHNQQHSNMAAESLIFIFNICIHSSHNINVYINNTSCMGECQAHGIYTCVPVHLSVRHGYSSSDMWPEFETWQSSLGRSLYVSTPSSLLSTSQPSTTRLRGRDL